MLHDLRKRCKELRYLLEFFNPLYGGKLHGSVLVKLKGLQANLGDFQDTQVQRRGLEGFADELMRRERLRRPGCWLSAAWCSCSRIRSARLVRSSPTDSRNSRGTRPSTARPTDRGGPMKTLATYSIKGGVLNTSAALNLAYLASRGGLRTLVWDLDLRTPQDIPSESVPESKVAGKRWSVGGATWTMPSRQPTTEGWTSCQRTFPTGTWTWYSTKQSVRLVNWESY